MIEMSSTSELMSEDSTSSDSSASVEHCDQMNRTDTKVVLPDNVWEELQVLHQTLLESTLKLKRDAINKEIHNFYQRYLRNPIKIGKKNKSDPVREECKEKMRHMVMQRLKDSLKVGHRDGTQDVDTDNLTDLEQSKSALLRVKSRLDYHQKQAIFYAVQSGKVLAKIKEMCIAENKSFAETLNEWDIRWSVSHRNFLIDLYYFARNYPRFVNISVSLFYFKANFNKIKSIVYASSDEKKFWRFQEYAIDGQSSELNTRS